MIDDAADALQTLARFLYLDKAPGDSTVKPEWDTLTDEEKAPWIERVEAGEEPTLHGYTISWL